MYPPAHVFNDVADRQPVWVNEKMLVKFNDCGGGGARFTSGSIGSGL